MLREIEPNYANVFHGRLRLVACNVTIVAYDAVEGASTPSISRATRDREVEQLIKAAGAELRYLPPYSPDMNPIEKAYSKLKAYLRKIAERTVAGLMRALETCADIFKPAECKNYFNACGYDTG